MVLFGTTFKFMKLTTVTKLKLISLCMGMMFWYGIEQLFMDKVLQDPSARAWTTFVFTATWLAFDIPGGLLADKFGRRRTLIVSSVLQILGLTTFVASQTLPIYLLGAFLYGLHWSTFAGTIQAFMYDHLLADERHHEYPRHQGSVTAYGYIGAAFANVLSGIIADHSSLRMPFVLSLLPAFFGFLLTLSLREIKVIKNKSEKPPRLRSYLVELFRAIQRQPIVAVYAAQIMVGLFIFKTICEFGQIFLLAYNENATWLGVLWAIDAAFVAFALRYAHHVQRWPWQTIGLYSVVLVLFAFVTSPIAIILFMLVYAGAEVMHNISETELQHVTPTQSRATVLSSVTFAGNLLALPLIFVFNGIFLQSSIHAANQFAAIGAAIFLAFTSIAIRRHLRKNKAIAG